MADVIDLASRRRLPTARPEALATLEEGLLHAIEEYARLRARTEGPIGIIATSSWLMEAAALVMAHVVAHEEIVEACLVTMRGVAEKMLEEDDG